MLLIHLPPIKWQSKGLYINKIFQHKIINIFSPIIFSICFVGSKEPSHCRLIETFLLVPTTYVLVEKYENYVSVTHSFKTKGLGEGVSRPSGNKSVQLI